MNTALPVTADCWNQVGIRGDRSCPELAKVVHCHNCPVFTGAGRRFLNAPSPAGYLEEWTARLAVPVTEAAADLQSVLVFRVGEEWLALPTRVLAEVTPWRQPHRVPHRGGLLAGLVNLRGELHLCVHLAQLLGIRTDRERGAEGAPPGRLLVTTWQQQRWVFPVDAVDQVHRVSRSALTPAPATLARSHHRFSEGVITWEGRSIGLLDAGRLFRGLEGQFR